VGVLTKRVVRNEEFHLVYERSTSCIRGIILRTTFSSDKRRSKARAHSFSKNMGVRGGKKGYLPTKTRDKGRGVSG
jgi:hypothetical protein